MDWKSRGWLILRWTAGLALLGLALRGLDWNQVREALSAVDWRWGAVALVSLVSSLVLKAVRWQGLLKGAAPRTSWTNLFGALLSGQAANIVLPLRGGEVPRVLLVAPGSVSRLAIAATIAAEKVFDLVALTVLAAGWLPGVYFGQQSGWAGVAATAAGALGLWVAVQWGEPIWKRIRLRLDPGSAARARGGMWQATAVRWGDAILAGFHPLRSPGSFIAATALTAIIWANMLATNLLLFTAFRIQVPLLAGITVLVLVHFGILPSLMPGNAGPFYFFTEAALLPFAVPAPVALSYAVVLHALVVLPPLVGGGLYLLAARRRTAGNPTV